MLSWEAGGWRFANYLGSARNRIQCSGMLMTLALVYFSSFSGLLLMGLFEEEESRVVKLPSQTSRVDPQLQPHADEP